MTRVSTESRLLPGEFAESWSPGETTRFWLLVGVACVVLDLGLGLAIAALEQANWGKDGLTPDVWLSLVAIVPQIGVVLAYLYVARDAEIRGLWKSMAGLFAAYLLMSGLALTMYEVLPAAGNVAIAIGAGIGIALLVVFSFGPWPRFAVASAALAPAAEVVTSDPTSQPAPEEESSAGSWLWHGIGLLVIFLVRRLLRNANWLPNFGLDGWALLEIVALAVIGLGFAVWFAAAKIRHREKLGLAAGVLGGAELLILTVHLGMAAALFWLMMDAAAANPQLDDADFDKLLDPWLRQASIVSAACHAVWALLTAGLFLSLWMRPQADWRADFLNPTARPLP